LWKGDAASVLGAEEDRKGDIPVLFRGGTSARALATDSEELVVSGADGLSRRPRCMELLLRSRAASDASSTSFSEKKLLFEAVMGVVGVFVACLARDGLAFLSDDPCSCMAAIFTAVGVPSRPSVIGGRRDGSRFFLDWGADGFLSRSDLDEGACTDLRSPGLLGGSLGGNRDRLPVELLRMLLASKARLDFRLSKNEISAGEILGDSYAFGMAGTGGTSSSSSGLMGFWILSAFGGGNLELAGCEIRGWMDPVEVLTVL
jgi:hypothetical protein